MMSASCEMGSSPLAAGTPCGKKDTRSTTKVCAAVLIVAFVLDSGFGGMMWGGRIANAEFLWKYGCNFIALASCLSAALIAIWYCLRSRKGTEKNQAANQLECMAKLSTTDFPTPTPNWRLNIQEIEQAARIGDAELAEKLFQDLERRGYKIDAFISNVVMRAFATKGDLVGAERWLSVMKSKGMKRSDVTYNMILDACAKSNKPDLCQKWVSRMTEDGVSPTAVSYSILISAHARQGNEEKPEILFNHMKAVGISPDAVCYNSMIHACGARGNFDGMARWLDEMTKAGHQPSVATFTLGIDACAKKGRIDEAESWMKRMIAAGLQPNVVSFSSLMDACGKTGKPERAGFWYDEMVKVGVQPNSYSFSAAISACAKAGNIEAAEAWLARAQDASAETGSDPILYSCVIDACSKINDADRAWRIFEQMRARGVRAHIVIYATLARPFAQRGDYQKVEEIRHLMEAEGFAANQYFMYAQLIGYAMARPRQEAKARDAFKEAVAQGMQINDRILDALRRAVGAPHASALHREAKKSHPESVVEAFPGPLNKNKPTPIAFHKSSEAEKFKTQMCQFWEQGSCRRGSNCTFAHGLDELCSEE